MENVDVLSELVLHAQPIPMSSMYAVKIAGAKSAMRFSRLSSSLIERMQRRFDKMSRSSIDYPDISLRHGDPIILLPRGGLGDLRGWSVEDIGKTFHFDRYDGFGCLRVAERPAAHVILQGSFG